MFIVDTGSKVTTIPVDKKLINKKINLPNTRSYQNVNVEKSEVTVKV